MLWPYSPRIHTKAARASGSIMSCAMSSCFSDEATRTMRVFAFKINPDPGAFWAQTYCG